MIQADDYYPFGLTFNSYSRENSVPNKFKFQSQEHIDDLGLNWDSFKWRNSQPDIGRFFNIDPLAQRYVYNSPYAFSENDPVSSIELEGLESVKASNFSPYQSDKMRELVKSIEKLKLFDSRADNIKIQTVREELLRIMDFGYTNGFVDPCGDKARYMIEKLKQARIPLPNMVEQNCSTTDIVETGNEYDDDIYEFYGVSQNKDGSLQPPSLIYKYNFTKETNDQGWLKLQDMGEDLIPFLDQFDFFHMFDFSQDPLIQKEKSYIPDPVVPAPPQPPIPIPDPVVTSSIKNN